MKYEKRKARLAARIKIWENLSVEDKKANKKPGSLNK